MGYEKLIELAKPYLEKNTLGVEHTLRVLEIAKKNYDKYDLDESWKDVVFSLIVLHDIGGKGVKEQYEKGPKRAKELLEKLGYHQFDIKLICAFIARHHERLNDPHDIFKILYDADHLVMLSKEEFKVYNPRAGFEWDNVIDGFYNAGLKEQAVRLLKERSGENGKRKK